MPRKRLSMRKIRDVLRLKYGLGRSHREIAAILRISHSAVGGLRPEGTGRGNVLGRSRTSWTTRGWRRRCIRRCRRRGVPRGRPRTTRLSM